jgi:MYND finger
MMSAVVEHTVLERRTTGSTESFVVGSFSNNGSIGISSRSSTCTTEDDGGAIVMAESGTFQLAPLPVGYVPQRLGFTNKENNGSSSIGSSGLDHVPLTRNSRLALPSTFTTTTARLKDKAVKEAFMLLANGEIQGSYQFEMLPPDENEIERLNDLFRLVLTVGCPAATSSTTHATAATATNTTAAQEQKLQGTTLMVVMLQLCTESHERTRRLAYGTKRYNECFSNALTLDEKEFLANRVLHLFLRAGLFSHLPVVCLSQAVQELDTYYSRRNCFEQILDVYIIKADVLIAKQAAQGTHVCEAAAQDHSSEVFYTLVSVGRSMESTAKVIQHHFQAGCVYEYIVRSFGSKRSLADCAMIHHYAALAFRNGHDFNKAEEHLVAGWYLLCSADGDRFVDINGGISTMIFTTFLVMCQMIVEEKSSSHGRQTGQRSESAAKDCDAVIDMFPLLCGLLYLAGFRAGQGGKSYYSVFHVGSQVAQKGFIRGGNLDQAAALNILIQAGARRDSSHFRQTILQSKAVNIDGINTLFSGLLDGGLDDAKRNARARKQQMREFGPAAASAISFEACGHCGTMQRADGRGPNFRCPCHKAAYCSRACQVSHRKEHKKICIAAPTKNGK